MNFWKAFLFFITASAFIIFTVWLSAWLNKSTGVLEKDSDVLPATVVTCPPNSLSYNEFVKGVHKELYLINEETKMYASGGKFINLEKIVSKSETKESKVACGYIRIITGTEDFGPLRSWENIFINPNGFGGHIDSINQIGLGDAEKYSEYVFPLSKISYWNTRADRVKGNQSEADWASLLNVNEKITFEIALNSQDRTGFIKEVAILYKCWDPATGKETDKCSLKVDDGKTTESVSPVK